MAEESARHNLLVTGTLAVICSLLVSLTAIGLGARQRENRELDRKRKILTVTGLLEPGGDIDEAYSNIRTRIVDLETGEYVDQDGELADYNQRRATSSPDLSSAVPPEEDIAGISRKEKYSYVYIVEEDGAIDQVVLPVRGRGLFSTLYAYVSLDSDLTTVRGIIFYEHGETAGLGAEVENPAWTAKWPDKHVYDDSGKVRLAVVKGTVDPGAMGADFKVDGLSGATMTSNGVSRLLKYWFGDSGFGPYLDRLSKEVNQGG